MNSIGVYYSATGVHSTDPILFNVLQIISLLECMNLTQYKQQFMKELVDGEILAECDEDILEKELNITSAIHRTRLLKVITGRHSATSFLEGGDLYSTLDHKL